ncbi:MAG: ATP-binding cassette domain-containing protein, partial [Candidatus Rokuibacteriota bacterium]
MTPTGPLVEVRNVWKSFERNRVLRGVSLALPKGTILAVMGGSGTGKTVLLRIASGLARPDAGEVYLFGTRTDRMREETMLPLGRRSGFVFQGAALFDSLSVFENVAYPLREHTRMSLGEIT